MNYLKKSKKCLVWPILMERTYKLDPSYWPRIQVGGYVWMDEKGKLHSKFRSYEKNWKDKLRKKVSGKKKYLLNVLSCFCINMGY